MRNAICAAKITSFLHKSKQNKRNCLSQACKTLSEGQNGPWEYSSSQKHMWVNMFENQGAGGYAWQGDKQYGLCLDTNTDWGMKAVKVVPQANGWVVIYGNCKVALLTASKQVKRTSWMAS